MNVTEQRKIKILYVLDYLSQMGGVQKIVNSFFINLNQKKYEISFLTPLTVDEEFERKIRENKGTIYHLDGIKEKNIIKYISSIFLFFKSYNDFDIIHIHQTYLDSIILMAAKWNKINCRIIHAHSTQITGGIYRRSIFAFFNYFDKYFATTLIACSRQSGEFIFGKKAVTSKKFILMHNAIEVNKYLFQEQTRNHFRDVFDLNEKIVLIIVGRLDPVKNHLFTLKIVRNLVEKTSNALLLIVGDGPERNRIKRYITKYNLKQKCFLLGERNDVSNLLLVADVLLMPSFKEGFPVTLIEAQAADLPCIVSDTITKDVVATDRIHFLSIEASADSWADAILKLKDESRKDTSEQLIAKGLDIQSQVAAINELYCSIVNNKKEFK